MAPAVVSAHTITTAEVERSKPFTGEVKVQDLRVPVKSVEAHVEANPDDLGPKRDIIIFSGTSGSQESHKIILSGLLCSLILRL